MKGHSKVPLLGGGDSVRQGTSSAARFPQGHRRVHLFTEFLQVLPETCPGSLLKRSWDTASPPPLPSEGFTGATEGDLPGAAQPGPCADPGIPRTPHQAVSTSCVRCFYPNEVVSLSATGSSHIAEPLTPAPVWALGMDGIGDTELGGWGAPGGSRAVTLAGTLAWQKLSPQPAFLDRASLWPAVAP